jgi:hypothetical protein
MVLVVCFPGGAVAQLGARLDGIEEVVGSNPIGSTKISVIPPTNLVKRVLFVALISLAAAYCCDSLWFRLRMLHPKPGQPLETVKALRLLAIPEKGGKTSYEIDQQNPEQTITCAHSWFPHSGYSPCWYVKLRIDQPIPM